MNQKYRSKLKQLITLILLTGSVITDCSGPLVLECNTSVTPNVPSECKLGSTVDRGVCRCEVGNFFNSEFNECTTCFESCVHCLGGTKADCIDKPFHSLHGDEEHLFNKYYPNGVCFMEHTKDTIFIATFQDKIQTFYQKYPLSETIVDQEQFTVPLKDPSVNSINTGHCVTAFGQRIIYASESIHLLFFQSQMRAEESLYFEPISYNLPEPFTTPQKGVEFSILLYIPNIGIGIAASPDYSKIVSFDLDSADSCYIENLEDDPVQFVLFSNQEALILYKEVKQRHVIKILSDSEDVYQTIRLEDRQNPTGEDMAADIEHLPISNVDQPLIFVLFDENKVEVLIKSNFNVVRVIDIIEWGTQTSVGNRGYIKAMQYSDYFVVAKEDQPKACIKNYSSPGQSERCIFTSMKSISKVVLSPLHKAVTFFDSEIALITQYLLPEIQCGVDSLITSCNALFLNDRISCIPNSQWNRVEKKCACKPNYFFDQNNKTCTKCQCNSIYGICSGSATNCNDDPFFQLALSKNDEVVYSTCVTPRRRVRS